MVDFTSMAEDYRRIEQALYFLERNLHSQPSLEEVASSVNLSEYHFQRLFTRWVGVSPKRFLQYLTKERAKLLLERSADLLEATYASGLSGPGRLHDLFVTCEAVTPGEYKRHGAGLNIRYGFHPTPFGECLLAATERGICHLAFAPDDDRDASFHDLSRRWRLARLFHDNAATRDPVEQIFERLSGAAGQPLQLFLSGTNFQLKVWEALLQIPPGHLTSYEAIAGRLGQPGASRAVGRAVGQNPVAVLIPCHRVIRKMGEFGGYRWGAPRKKAILGWELAHLELSGVPTY